MSDAAKARETPETPAAGKPVEPVTRKSLIAHVLDTRPEAGKVLREVFKLPCEECVVAEAETIEEGARYYALDADAMVARLNECKVAEPEKPPITDAKDEKKPA